MTYGGGGDGRGRVRRTPHSPALLGSRQGGTPARAHRILVQVDNLDNRVHPDTPPVAGLHSQSQAGGGSSK